LLSSLVLLPSQENLAQKNSNQKRSSFLGADQLKAQVGAAADEPFISDIGGLLQIALCGRISL